MFELHTLFDVVVFKLSVLAITAVLAVFLTDWLHKKKNDS